MGISFSPLHLFAVDPAVSGTGAHHQTPLAQQVQMDDAADGGRQKAQCGDGQAEAAAARKAQTLIDHAVVQRLTGALTVAKGQQHAGGREVEVGNQQHRQQGDAHAQNGLQQIGGHGGDTAVEDLHSTGLGHLAAAAFEGGGNKAQRQSVIGDDLQRGRAVAAEKSRVKHGLAGAQGKDRGDQQQNAAAQHRGGDQGFFQTGDVFFQKIGCQQAEQQNGHQIEGPPNTKVPKIRHVHSPLRYFCVGRTG